MEHSYKDQGLVVRISELVPGEAPQEGSETWISILKRTSITLELPPSRLFHLMANTFSVSTHQLDLENLSLSLWVKYSTQQAHVDGNWTQRWPDVGNRTHCPGIVRTAGITDLRLCSPNTWTSYAEHLEKLSPSSASLLDPCYSTSGLRTSCVIITWAFHGNADSASLAQNIWLSPQVTPVGNEVEECCPTWPPPLKAVLAHGHASLGKYKSSLFGLHQTVL